MQARTVFPTLALAAAGFTSCGAPGPGPITAHAVPAGTVAPSDGGSGATGAAPRTENVVLVTIDGVRWQEIFGGVDAALAARARMPGSAVVPARELLPNLSRLFFDGGTVLGDPARGGGFAATGPRFVSLPAYVELMSGAPSGCFDNDCEPLAATSLPARIAEGAGAPTLVLGSWERVARAVPEAPAVVVRAGRDDDAVPPHPGLGRYRPDRVTAHEALRRLVDDKPRFLWLSLGDTDEWAHRGDYRGYLEALRYADAVVGEIAAHLAELGDYGRRTTILVTTDHGRDANFTDHGGRDSGAVWLLARGGSLRAKGSIATQAPRYLRDVAPTVLRMLGRPVDACDGCGQVLDEVL